MGASEIYLGELEQQLLLVVLHLGDDAYANPIREMLASAAERPLGAARCTRRLSASS